MVELLMAMAELLEAALSILFEVLGGIFDSPGKGSQIERINFRRGQTSAFLHGVLHPYTDHTYKLRGLAGQILTVSLQQFDKAGAKADVVFWVRTRMYLPGSDTTLLEGIDKRGVTQWDGRLPLTGEYEINVSHTKMSYHVIKRALSYNVRVSVS